MAVPGSDHPWVRAGVSIAAFVAAVFLLARFHAPSWLVSLVQAGFTGWLIYLTGDAFLRSRHIGDPGPGRMAQPVFILGLGLVGTVFFGALEIFCVFWPNETVTWWVLAGFGVFTAASAFLVLDALLGHHSLSARGMVHRNWWGRPSEFAWADVVRLRWHGAWKLYRICRAGARPLWVWSTLSGQQEFARLALAGVGPGAVDTLTLEILRNAEAGSLPPTL